MRLDHYFPSAPLSYAESGAGGIPTTFPTYAILFSGLVIDGFDHQWLRSNRFSGDHSEEAIPVPFPNTAVKLLSGDGTMVLAMGE